MRALLKFLGCVMLKLAECSYFKDDCRFRLPVVDRYGLTLEIRRAARKY